MAESAESIDLGVAMIEENDDDNKFARFVGAIRAAERLGYSVEIVTVRDGRKVNPRIHMLIARATWREPGTVTVRMPPVPPPDSEATFRREPGR